MGNAMTITDSELDRLEALASAATPGPWHDDQGSWVYSSNPDACRAFAMMNAEDTARFYVGACIGESMGTADAAFIAASRSAVPKLIAEVRALRSLLREALPSIEEDLSVPTEFTDRTRAALEGDHGG